MNHYAKIYSVWRIFDFVKNFAKKAREDWALRQTEPQNNLFLVKDLWYGWFQVASVTTWVPSCCFQVVSATSWLISDHSTSFQLV